MDRRRFFGFAALISSLFAAVYAQADGSDHVHACNSGTGSAAIDGCTWVIQSNKYSGADLATAYARRGDALAVAGQYTRAIDDYTQAIKLKPDYVVALFNRGFAYGNLRDYRHSVDDFTAAIKLDPNNAKGYINRAISLRHMNENQRAIDDLDKAIQLNSNDGYAFNERAWIRAILGQLDAALGDCRQANHFKPDNKYILSTCAFIHFRQGNYEEAVKDADRALALDSGRADPLFIRGLSRLHLGDRAGSSADVHEATLLDPKIAETYSSYGVKP